MKRFSKHILSILTVTAVVAVTVINVRMGEPNSIDLLSFDLKALSDGNGGNESGGNSSWENKRLKNVSCRCYNHLSIIGTTTICHPFGQLAQCTATQQGSNICYLAASTYPTSTICEGSGSFFVYNIDY